MTDCDPVQSCVHDIKNAQFQLITDNWSAGNKFIYRLTCESLMVAFLKPSVTPFIAFSNTYAQYQRSNDGPET